MSEEQRQTRMVYERERRATKKREIENMTNLLQKAVVEGNRYLNIAYRLAQKLETIENADSVSQEIRDIIDEDTHELMHKAKNDLPPILLTSPLLPE